ncbi:hypothetical protein GCM10027194_08570 [Thalassiella azotivora]
MITTAPGDRVVHRHPPDRPDPTDQTRPTREDTPVDEVLLLHQVTPQDAPLEDAPLSAMSIHYCDHAFLG